MLRSAIPQMLPPRPPSPPSGPPRGTNFSLRKLAMPSPPFPACTSMVASSTNFMVDCMDLAKQKALSRGQGFCRRESGLLLRGDDVHRLAVRSAVLGELHPAVDFGEQGMVPADADVVPGVNLGSALADDDASGGDELAAVG